MTYKLIAAINNGGTDYLLLIDDKVVSRWAVLESQDFGDLADWDNQAAAGADLSDYQDDLEEGRYNEVVTVAEQSVPEWMPDGEMTNGDALEFTTPYRLTESAATEDVFDRLSQLTKFEKTRVKWVGVRRLEDGVASAAKIIDLR
jgi:hypothetical protein